MKLTRVYSIASKTNSKQKCSILYADKMRSMNYMYFSEQNTSFKKNISFKMCSNLLSTICRTYSSGDNKKSMEDEKDLEKNNDSKLVDENALVNSKGGIRFEETTLHYIFTNLQNVKYITSYIFSTQQINLIQYQNSDKLLKEYKVSFVQLFSEELSLELLNLKIINIKNIIKKIRNINKNNLKNIINNLDNLYVSKNKDSSKIKEIISLSNIKDIEIKNKIKELIEISVNVNKVNGQLQDNQLSLLNQNVFFNTLYNLKKFQLDCAIANIKNKDNESEEYKEDFKIKGMSIKLPTNSILVSEFTVAYHNTNKKISQLIKNGIILRVLLNHSYLWKIITFKNNYSKIDNLRKQINEGKAFIYLYSITNSNQKMSYDKFNKAYPSIVKNNDLMNSILSSHFGKAAHIHPTNREDFKEYFDKRKDWVVGHSFYGINLFYLYNEMYSSFSNKFKSIDSNIIDIKNENQKIEKDIKELKLKFDKIEEKFNIMEQDNKEFKNRMEIKFDKMEQDNKEFKNKMEQDNKEFKDKMDNIIDLLKAKNSEKAFTEETNKNKKD